MGVLVTATRAFETMSALPRAESVVQGLRGDRRCPLAVSGLK